MNQQLDRLNQLEDELDKLWQEKWRYRINMAKNDKKLYNFNLDNQDYESTNRKLYKFTLKMKDIRGAELKLLEAINQYELPTPIITDELANEVTLKLFRVSILPIEFEADIFEFWFTIPVLPKPKNFEMYGMNEIYDIMTKIIEKDKDLARYIKKSLEDKLKKGRKYLTSFLEMLEIKWWKLDTETLEEKTTRFDKDWQALKEAVTTIRSYAGETFE